MKSSPHMVARAARQCKNWTMTVQRDEPDWFRMEHELDPSLPDDFSMPVLHRRSRDAYQHVGVGGWTGYWPPEDLAVRPDVEWTEEQKVLVLAAYREKWGRFLEPNHTYEINWPPEPYLVDDGYVVGGALVCNVHTDEGCMECDEFHEGGEVRPAEWTWSAMIEMYEWNGNSGFPESFEWFRFLTMRMDPREVDYEPFSTGRD